MCKSAQTQDGWRLFPHTEKERRKGGDVSATERNLQSRDLLIEFYMAEYIDQRRVTWK